MERSQQTPPCLSLVLFCSALFLLSFSNLSNAEIASSETPPRGWNSYDSFSWIINEQELLDNAKVVANKLKGHGYEYVVVDFLWYRKNVKGKEIGLDAKGYDNIDEWGRVIPDPERFPSSRGGKGFRKVARKVHDMGLKFGIHCMRGISDQAVSAKTPIYDVSKGSAYQEGGRTWHSDMIAKRDAACPWLTGFMSVNTELGAGKAFLKSLYTQYADWGVDFVKLDCVFGDNLDQNEIITVSEILQRLTHPILFSLSPGVTASPAMAEGISKHVDMYRITGDDWDTWPDVASHFNIAGEFANTGKIGAMGLHGKSWPDLDMLPLGWLTDPGVQKGPHRKCRLTLDEQKTQMTLWSMAKSPLMFGGDLRRIDRTTLALITNPVILEINSHSSHNREFPNVYLMGDSRRDRALAQTHASRDTLDRKQLQLTRCNQDSTRWFASSEGGSDKICWNNKAKSGNCLFKRSPPSDKQNVYNEKYRGKFQLVETASKDTCLDATVSRKLTASENPSTSLAVCEWNANQMWELNGDGTLVSSYSGLCAKPESKREHGNTEGVRAWIATGRHGEVYLSFFNLNPARKQISVDIGDISKALPRKPLLPGGSCKCSEVWSGRQFGIIKKTLSMMVEAHGCALFILQCST